MTNAKTGSLTAEEVQRSFHRLTPWHDPLLQHLTRDELYDGGRWMAPGGLLLAKSMAGHLDLKPGCRVLDLGCGRGQSSVFLAAEFGATVVSLDLWMSAEERKRSAILASVGALVTPMQGDITRGLPSGLERFDAVFCLQAFHCFGTRLSTVRYLATLLKPGGRLCISQGCFKQEPITLPPLFRETGGWQPEYEKYHSPGWWRDHLLASGEFEVELAEELPHGGAIWEDDVLYRGDRSGWSDEFLTRSGWLIRQIAHGQTGTPSLTHCIVRAVKTEERS